MLERLAWHRAEGHRIVIVSASLDSYLVPLAPRLGVDDVLSCSLGADAGVLDGTLVGGNVRGPEKVRRLQQWLDGEAVELWAYGDSAGDDELLALADHPTRITH
jgi:HAD superfamily hydrolase (TIGR01490 family)